MGQIWPRSGRARPCGADVACDARAGEANRYAVFFFLFDTHRGARRRAGSEVGTATATPVLLKRKGDVHEIARDEGISEKRKWRRMMDEIARELPGKVAVVRKEKLRLR